MKELASYLMGRECTAKRVMPLTQSFCVLIFSAIRFLLFFISLGSNNITVIIVQ